MNDFFYRKLDTYQLAKQFAIEVCHIAGVFPNHEKYGLSDQLRRAAISIPSNIAEGTGRIGIRERMHFLDIANGSLFESVCQLEIAKELNYIGKDDFRKAEELASRVSMTLIGLKKSLQDKLSQQQ